MITTIFFDIGNVLVGFDHRLIWQRLAVFSVMTADEIGHEIGASGIMLEHESGRLASQEFFRDIQRRCKLLPSMPYQTFCAFWQDIFWELPDVIQLVIPLQRRYRVGLLSNVGELHWQGVFKKFPVFHLIEEPLRILSFQVGAMKPDQAIFDRALRQANAAPEECIYVDDLEANVAGGSEAGLKTIHYRSPEQLKEELRQYGVTW
ncbi:haloacid dehalogenase [Candidatus Moduliflexus flocculans]|uniref:Haloacid dehalogenase n=1 Tax=Candidatus Moduliflexus flocculans TaxID=1499966 RepID=A0A0S6VPH1_9BACT|nr:haloacid dehalogenase [Candidatus Moduliflexus flocculans]